MSKKRRIKKLSIIEKAIDEVDIVKTSNKKNKIILLIIGIAIISAVSLSYFLVVPRIKLNGKYLERISYGSEYKEKGAVNKTYLPLTKNKIKISGKVNTEKLGDYSITYDLKELLLSTKLTRTVSVIDNEKPIITLVGNETSMVCPGKKYVEEGYTATDNYDKDITSKVKVISNTNDITYKVSDSSKNVFSIKRNLVYEDKVLPVINLNGSDVSVLKGNKYNESGYNAIDNCDGDITSKVIVNGSVDTNKVGTYTLTYSVNDSSGNNSSVSRKVRVYQYNYSPITPGSATVYLTFDDGPSSTITPGVLDILKEEGVKATFFVIDHGTGLDYLIKRAYNEGHTIGIHSSSHNYSTIYSSDTAFYKDLYAIRNRVYNITGEYSNIIRFPGGSSNTVSRKYSSGIMTRLSSSVMTNGFIYYDWNVGSNDTSKIGSDAVYNNVIKGLSANKVNIVLMHDFGGNYKTLNALRNIIKQAKSLGYKFDRITSSTPQVKQRIAN